MYCSRKCQLTAFPQHRFDCFALPALREISLSDRKSETTMDGPKSLIVTSPQHLQKKQDSVPMMTEISAHNKQVEKESPALIIEKNKVVEAPPAKQERVVEAPPVARQEKIVEEKKAPAALPKPAFNQGERTNPPNQYAKSVASNVSTSSKNKMFSTSHFRANQQMLVEPEKPERLSAPKRIFLSDMTVSELPIGKKTMISIINGDEESKIYCVVKSTPDMQKVIRKIDKSIVECVNNNKTNSYKPQENEMVLAQFEGAYYRGVCKRVMKNNQYEIYFVDYGNSAIVKDTEIIQFEAKLKGDLFAVRAHIENIPKREELTEELMVLLANEAGKYSLLFI
jgi:hypothetical protein